MIRNAKQCIEKIPIFIRAQSDLPPGGRHLSATLLAEHDFKAVRYGNYPSSSLLAVVPGGSQFRCHGPGIPTEVHGDADADDAGKSFSVEAEFDFPMPIAQDLPEWWPPELHRISVGE